MRGQEKNQKIYVIMIDDQPYSTVHWKRKTKTIPIIIQKFNSLK